MYFSTFLRNAKGYSRLLLPPPVPSPSRGTVETLENRPGRLHALDELPRLAVRNAVQFVRVSIPHARFLPAVHIPDSAVVRGQRKSLTPSVVPEQKTEIPRSNLDVGGWLPKIDTVGVR